MIQCRTNVVNIGACEEYTAEGEGGLLLVLGIRKAGSLTLAGYHNGLTEIIKK